MRREMGREKLRRHDVGDRRQDFFHPVGKADHPGRARDVYAHRRIPRDRHQARQAQAIALVGLLALLHALKIAPTFWPLGVLGAGLTGLWLLVLRYGGFLLVISRGPTWAAVLVTVLGSLWIERTLYSVPNRRSTEVAT